MKKRLLLLLFIGASSLNLFGNDSDLVKSLLLPDELKSKYYIAATEKDAVDALNDICFYLNNSEPGKAENLSKVTLRISDSLNYLEGLYDANNNIGISFYRTAKYQQALTCFKQALEYAKILGDKGREAAVLSNMALVYVDLSDYDRALIFNKKALKLRTISGDSSAIAISYSNLGMTYHQKGDYTIALDYYYQGLKIKEQQKDKDGIANSCNNIGQLFLEMNSDSATWAIDSSLVYLFRAYNYYNSTDNRVGLAKVLLNMANAYDGSDNDNKALESYRAALNAQKQLNDSVGIALTYYNMAIHFINLYQNEMAENHFLKSLTIANRFNLLELQKDNLKELFLINNNKGDYKTASTYADRLIVVDELIGDLSRISLAEKYNGKYEYQLFENLELQKQVSHTRVWLIIITVIALSLTGIFLIWYFMREK